jgi:hypothetical protein
MDELNRLADDYEWFLQAIALGVIRRKVDAGDREAAFQPRGQYLFEVEPGSGEWLQIGNEYAIRSNGLPPYYREQVIAAVRKRQAGLGPHQLLLLAALMRHYQLRVYEPRLETDETGAQLPSPSLPNITARRLYEAWLRRAQSLDSTLSNAAVDAALAAIAAWTDTVPDSALDAYSWEVERPIDKRIVKPEILASEARAAAALEVRALGSPANAAAPIPDPAPAPPTSRYKLFVGGAQRGPFAVDEVARQLARGEIEPGTRAWDMAQDPKSGKWRTVADIPGLAGMAGQAPSIPDPDDGVPDPQ